MRIRSVRAELLRTDEQTQLRAAFRNFANGSKSGVLNYHINLIIPIQITSPSIETYRNMFRERYKKHLTYHM